MLICTKCKKIMYPNGTSYSDFLKCPVCNEYVILCNSIPMNSWCRECKNRFKCITTNRRTIRYTSVDYIINGEQAMLLSKALWSKIIKDGCPTPIGGVLTATEYNNLMNYLLLKYPWEYRLEV